LKIFSAKLVCSAPESSQFPRDNLPEFAFIGRSNVGKSSLINSLLKQRHLARTSSTPGRTRLINFFRINENFYFVDCPGYGYSKASKILRRSWSHLIDQYLEERKQLCSCVVIIDSRIGPTPLDVGTIKWLQQLLIPFFVVLTKADKLNRSELQKSLKHTESLVSGVPVLAYSSTKGIGHNQVWLLLNNYV